MSESNQTVDIEKLTADLSRELSPQRDLWPGIAARLERPASRRWVVPVAIAASLVLSATSAVFTWQLYRERQDQAQALAATLDYLQALQSPYRPVRANFERQWPELKEQLDPETAAVVERNLGIIRKANDELMEALQQQPRNATLQRLLRQTLAREVDVYRQTLDAARTVSYVEGPPMTGEPRSTMKWKPIS